MENKTREELINELKEDIMMFTEEEFEEFLKLAASILPGGAV